MEELSKEITQDPPNLQKFREIRVVLSCGVRDLVGSALPFFGRGIATDDLLDLQHQVNMLIQGMWVDCATEGNGSFGIAESGISSRLTGFQLHKENTIPC